MFNYAVFRVDCISKYFYTNWLLANTITFILANTFILTCLYIYYYNFLYFRCPFSEKATERAIYERLSNIQNLPNSYSIKKPEILQSSVMFEYSRENVTKTNNQAVPCPSCNGLFINFNTFFIRVKKISIHNNFFFIILIAIIWSDVPNPLEVSVNGKKQGVTKKNFKKPSSR